MNDRTSWIMSPVDTGLTPISFFHDLTIQKPLKKAVWEITSIGVYAAYINGIRVGDEVLAPGFTDYFARVQVQSYDVTHLLGTSNRLEIGVGPGWGIDFRGHGHRFAKQISLWAKLTLTDTDGTRTVIGTNTDWEVTTSQITHSELYHGETVDLTAPITPLGKAVRTRIKGKRIPQLGEKIREQERIAPVSLIRTPAGETVIDFGQNLTGYVEIRIQGKRGDRIVLHHAEVLDKHGNFYTANMRSARNECIYILDGNENVCKPTFSFQGFRYVRLTEYPSTEIDLSRFTAVVVHSDIKRTGTYHCGYEKLNQLYHNIIWGQKSNYLDIPTDCPQRDERLGWTGDAQVFCRTAAINFDVERFLCKWLGDMMIEQAPDGTIPGVTPYYIGEHYQASAAWGDAAVIVPWELYMAYGNINILQAYFPMMQKWVEHMHASGPEEFLWLGDWHYGDWLGMDAGGDSYTGATPKDLIASAFYAHSTALLIKAGEVLGRDMSEYRALYDSIVKAFRARYLPGGRLSLVPDLNEEGIKEPPAATQTAYVLILHFGLCEEKDRQALADALAALIRQNNGLMTTGFVGTPYLLHALSDNGYALLAYDLLLEERFPSWLYSVNHGATTMWEHWNGIKENGDFWSADMNSFNHYAYGAVYDWMFGSSVGIKPLEPAYQKIKIEPHPDRRLGFADASIDSRNGRIRAHWYYKGDTIHYEFEIPAGVTAHLRLPSGAGHTLTGGRYLFAE